ncbi:cell wall-recycling L,D-carboxypeptidase ElsL [soil metagenome]
MKKSTSIHISVPKQLLRLKRGRVTERSYPISTSQFGLGTEEGSFKTPTGRFRIAEKIGAGQPLETAYQARVPLRPSAKLLASDDLVMSRILWLDGLDPKNANTFQRYIYIHGTNHEELIGQPASHGCVRMRNADVAELFELVEIGTRVTIAAGQPVGRIGKSVKKSLRLRGDLPK